MKVLHVIPSLAASTGGPAFGTVDMALAVQAEGVDVSIYTTDMATPARSIDRRLGVSWDDVPDGASDLDVQFFRVRRPYRLAYSPALGSSLNSSVPLFDLVHIHSLFLYPQFAAARAAQRFGVPYVVSPHGALDPYLRQRGRGRKWLADRIWQRRMLNRAASLHLTSAVEAQQLRGLGLRADRQIGPYGVRTKSFALIPKGDRFRTLYLQGYSGPLVLFHGRLAEKKGLEVLISAFAELLERGFDARLAIVGPDNEGLEAVLRFQAENLGVEDKVAFPGILRGDDLLEAFGAADIWAMPSRGENFAIAVMEALAAGLPVVISPEVNIAAVIAQENAGIIADANPSAFSQAMSHLLLDQAAARALRLKARTFSTRFDWQDKGEEMKSLYVRAILAQERLRLGPKQAYESHQ